MYAHTQAHLQTHAAPSQQYCSCAVSTGGTVPKGDYERFDAELEPQSVEEQGVKVRAAHSAVHTIGHMYSTQDVPSLA